MAVEMRERVRALARDWAGDGHQLSLGIGVAQGYATLGRIGFEGRYDYAAIGSVTNLAARLCDEAKPWQILVTRRVLAAAGNGPEANPLGDLQLRGFSRPFPVFNVLSGEVPS
jgi:class 3 adenylate cyclase